MAGPKLSKEEFSKVNTFDKEYKVYKKLNDPRFGDILLIKNDHSEELLLCKEKVSNTESEAGKNIVAAKRRMSFNHPHLQKFYDYSANTKSDFCSTHYLTKGYYEWFPNDVRRALEKRRGNNRFTHEELTHMAYQVLDALAFLHSNGATYDDVRPDLCQSLN